MLSCCLCGWAVDVATAYKVLCVVRLTGGVLLQSFEGSVFSEHSRFHT